MTVRKGRVSSISPHDEQPSDTGGGEHGGADGEEDEDEDEVEENAGVKKMKNPGSPTREELDHHYLTHMPYRSWCPICVQGKGKENPHRRKKEKVIGDKPTIAMDYKSFGESIVEDDKRTAVIIRDSATITTHAHVVDCKGTGDPMWSDELLKTSTIWATPILS